MSRTGRLSGRNCLIVGGTSGIGLAAARRFLEEGASVVVSGQTLPMPNEAPAGLDKLGPIWMLAADVSDPVSIATLFRDALDALKGRLDVLFHVAGISGRRFGDGSLHECTLEGWDVVLDANARGTFLTNQAAVRQMLTQRPDDFGLRGAILNTGSVLGRSPAPEFFGTYAYAASKGAIRAMTLAAASRYACDRIRVNLLAPALIDTPMAARAVSDPQIREYLKTKQPLAGGPGTPFDCAEAALYLCEPASHFVTGTELTVDGGWCISEGQIPAENTEST